MRILSNSIAVLAIAMLIAGAACSQAIQVTVDGTPVVFRGVGPQSVQGRVLVPLRGVFEYMGAFVDWLPSTRTVMAQKGDTDVQLRIGSRVGIINGREVTLDVPAQIIGGSTMAPLRFLGEALGAEVTWAAATRTVLINTTGGPIDDAGGDQTGKNPPTIDSFRHDAQEWVRAGDVIEVKMVGTAGGTATFRIPGVVDATSMRETGRGTYVATWTVPNRALTISGAGVLGSLKTTGGERLIQAGAAVSIDTVPPKISDLLPANKATAVDARPTISAILDDEGGSGIDTNSVKLLVTGHDVTNNTTITPTFVTFRPPAALGTGATGVKLTVSDLAGNTVTKQWSFGIAKVAGDLVTSFTYDAPEELVPGESISVRMQAEAGGQATFSIGSAVSNGAMTESSSGVYVGEYTIRRNVDVSGAAVTGKFRSKSGQTLTVQAESRLGSTSGVIQKPVITAPTQDSNVSSPLVVKGTATANTRVRVDVKYATTVIGNVRVNGALSSQAVVVDARGRFVTQPIALDTLIKGKDTEYTITATALNAQGEESEQTVITVGKA